MTLKKISGSVLNETSRIGRSACLRYPGKDRYAILFHAITSRDFSQLRNIILGGFHGF